MHSAGLGRWLAEVLVGCLLQAASCALQAQDQPPPPSPDLTEASLEELMNIEVYGASRYLQKISEAPAFITVVSRDEIAKYGYRTLSDLLRAVPGFYVSYDRNYSYLGMRGFSRPGDYNTRFLLLVDGHRLNDPVYDQAPLGTEFPVDVDLIERVEVIRGPASSLYGSNAFFGLINVITRRGREVKGLELSADAGAFGAYHGRATWGGRWHGLEMLLSASFYDSRGQTLYYPEFDTPPSSGGFTGHADDDAFRNFLLTASFRGFTLHAVYGWREKGIPTGAWGTVFADPSTRTTDQRAFLDLSYERQLERWEVAARVYYDWYRYDGTYCYAGEEPGTQVLNMDYGRSQTWGGELQLSRRLGRHYLVGGAELRQNLRQDQVNYDLLPYTLYLHDERDSLVSAVYVQDTFTLASWLTLNAGLRHDQYSSVGGTTNPRLGVVLRPAGKTTVKLLYGTAFRSPNVYELYYGSEGTQKANPRLRPETIRTGEVVVEQWMGKRLRLAGSYYRSHISGLISQKVDPADGLIVFQNLARVRASGVELALDGRLERGIGQSRSRQRRPPAHQLQAVGLGQNHLHRRHGKGAMSARVF